MAEEKTYCACILNDVLDIALGVDFCRGVCTIHSELWVLRNFKWETLTVRDMPVESVDLQNSSATAT
jgi:hypothetical protein